MKVLERVGHGVDDFQQKRSWLALPVAVVKKFGEDNGGLLATQIAYSAFFSILPLLLVLVTVLGYVLKNDPALQKHILNSAVVDFPIVGAQLTDNLHGLPATGVAAVIGVVGLLIGARGLAQSAQFAMAEVWSIPGAERPGFVERQVRGLIMFGVFTLGLAVTTGLTTLTGLLGSHLTLRVLSLALSALANVGLFLLAFRVLTPKLVTTRRLVIGAAIAGLAWQVLLTLGSYLVEHYLRHASELYGFFGVVLGLLAWLYLGARITLYSAEVNVVLARRLWPRSLVQSPLTKYDERALRDLARKEERLPGQNIEVTFKSAPKRNDPRSDNK